MEIRSNALVAAGVGAVASPILPSLESWRLAREAHRDLQIVGTQRANLLLVGTGGTIRNVLEMLWLQLQEPILSWHPGQRLELPSPGRAATLILHDVSELTSDDQLRVVRWLDRAGGRIRIISTSAVALWPRVEAGTFNDVLYYRLNTVYVDVAVLKN